MKNLFYVIAGLGFGYVSYMDIKYWSGTYGLATLFVYQLLASIPFLGFWIYFLFRKKTALNIALSIVSFILFVTSWVLTSSIISNIE